MLRRRVPVLRLGSRGPGGDQKSLRLCPQAFAECRACLGVENHRETQNCRHFWTCDWSSRLKSVNGHKGAVVVAKPRTVVTFGLAFGLRVPKVSTVTGGLVVVAKRRTVVTFGLAFGLRVSKVSKVTVGSWSRNPELSSLLDLRLVFASQKVSTVTRIGRVVVAKHRTVVTFGLTLGLRVSSVVTFGLAFGEKREERREGRREERRERRGERGEERREERE